MQWDADLDTISHHQLGSAEQSWVVRNLCYLDGGIYLGSWKPNTKIAKGYMCSYRQASPLSVRVLTLLTGELTLLDGRLFRRGYA